MANVNVGCIGEDGRESKSAHGRGHDKKGSCTSAQLLLSPKIGLRKAETTQLYRTTCKVTAP